VESRFPLPNAATSAPKSSTAVYTFWKRSGLTKDWIADARIRDSDLSSARPFGKHELVKIF